MMIRYSVSAIVGVVFATSAVVEATNYVWLEAEPVTAGAIVVEDGEGRALSLECDPAAQEGDVECIWDVTVRIANDEPLWAWALDLGTEDEFTSIVSYSYLEPHFTEAGVFIRYLPFELVLETVPGAGTNLIRQFGAGSLIPAPIAEDSYDGIAWSVAQFRLVKQITSQDSGLVTIFGRTGVSAYGPAPGSLFPGIVGDNPEMDLAPPLTPYPNALITIVGPQGESYIPGEGGGAIIWEEPVVPEDNEDDADTVDDQNNDDGGDTNENENNEDSNADPDSSNGSNNTDGNGGAGSNNGNPNAGGSGSGSSNTGNGNGDQGGFTITQTNLPTTRPLFDLTGLCGPSAAANISAVALMILGLRRRRSRRSPPTRRG